MAGATRRIVDLRPGEGELVAKTGLTLFGLIAAHTMLETARDALFLGTLPVSRLALVYALLAVLSLGAAQANGRFVSAFGRRNGLIFTLLGATFGTVVLYLLEPTRPVVFGLYVWTGLLGSIIVVQFWMLVGHAFTVAQGKRLFGLLAAGGVLGAVAGAASSAALLELVPVRELLGLAALAFLGTAFFLTTIEVDDVPDAPRGEKARAAMSGALDLFREYPYLARLAALIGISTAAVLATDYLFKWVAAERLPEADLGPFFARYYTALNAVALVVQLLVSGSLVRRVGVVGAFMVLPLLLALGAGASFVLASGVAVFLTKGADGALRHSLHRIAAELLWMPLPEHVRTRAKGVIDTVVVRGTQAATAGVLLGLAALGLDTPRVLSASVLGLSLLWLSFALALRRPYLDLFRAALGQRGGRGRLELDLRSVEVVVEALSSRDTQQAVAAIDLLAASRRTRLIPALVLYHESTDVLLRALEVLPERERTDWVPLAERLLGHDQEAVRAAALEALAQTGHHEVVKGRLLDISPWVRAHAAFWLVHTAPDARPRDDASIRLILEMPSSGGLEARVGLLEAIEASGDGRWADLLLELAEADEPEVAHAAVRAMTTVQDPRFLPLLVRRLSIRTGRATVRDALVALGEPAFEALERALNAPQTPTRVRTHVPATLARFGTQRAADVLLDALEATSDGRLRYKILRALRLLAESADVRLERRRLEARVLRELREHYRMAGYRLAVARARAAAGDEGLTSGGLLEGLLADKRDQALDRVFLLLQASFPDEELRSVRAAARSGDRRRRAQAQEFLDALTLGARAPELRPLLRLSVDDLPEEERLRRAREELGGELSPGAPPTRDLDTASTDAALHDLLQDEDAAVSSLAAYHVLETGQLGPRGPVGEDDATRSITQDLRVLARRLGGATEASSVA
jgi:hypothetical protein